MTPPAILAASMFKDPMFLFIAGLTLMVLFFWYFATDSELRKRNIGTILTIGICAFCGLAIYPPKDTLHGGIDLVGGFSYTLQVSPKLDEATGKPIPLTKEEVSQAQKIVESRLNSMGTKDMSVVVQGDDKIQVQMPGVSKEESEAIRVTLEKVAKLELHQVNLDGFRPDSSKPALPGQEPLTLAHKIYNRQTSQGTPDEQASRVPGYTAYPYKIKGQDEKEITTYILLSNRVALTGKDVERAWPESRMGDVSVGIYLYSKGEDKMINLTKDMKPGVDRIAVLLDGEVLTAPVVQSVPLGRNFQISGQKDQVEARALANSLMNPLETPLKIIADQVISPTLGDAVIKQGVWAGIAGLGMVALFVLVYYRSAGFVALVGLLVNAVMLIGGMAIFGFTFTLPGIAGMILTIGMAVDANVLIYERLREEIAAGKSLKVALAAAYDRAFTAIFDANITSLITSTILFWVGTGSVKGFAITLTIGLICSMFSSILVTRVLFRWSTDFNVLKKFRFLNLIRSKGFDFMGISKMSYAASGLLALACIATAAIRGENSLGIDFTGGTNVTFELGERVLDAHEVEAAVAQVPTKKLPNVVSEKSLTGKSITIRCAEGDGPKIVSHLRETIPMLGEKKVVDGKEVDAIPSSSEGVSAALGVDFMWQSLYGLVLGLAGILIYVTIRFEFSFALGGFIAILHDVLLAAGIIVLCGHELSMIHVGALLTIAGYSINDTIVIFDRIRETLKTHEGDVKDLMNEAINSTLSRTILTSTATAISVILIAVFGSGALRDFSIIILIGIIVGTYSSIFIASPVVLWWSQRKGGNLRGEVMRTSLAEADIQAAP